jgi:hypothetical protein
MRDAAPDELLIDEPTADTSLADTGTVAIPGRGSPRRRVVDDRALFMALDLVEGATPLDLTRGSREQALRGLVVAASRVGLCHRKGVVHRDVKPQNFLVSSSGVIYLSDFGSAKTIGLDGAPDDDETEVHRDPTLTEPGTIMGTPVFMSPEQFRDPVSVDARTDVFALGVTLYHALTARLPYQGRSIMELMNAQLLMAQGLAPLPPAPRALDPSVPAAVDRLCMEAISLSPDERPVDGFDFADRLADAVGLARPGRPLPPPARRAPAPRLPRHAVLAAFGASPTGFVTTEQLRRAVARLGEERAGALAADVLGLQVTQERPVGGATRYLGQVALVIPRAGGRVTVGRGADCDLPLDLATISKLHLVLERDRTSWTATEQGSSNGTTVNGDRLVPGARRSLTDGDELRVSDHVTFTVLSGPRLLEALSSPAPT